MFQHHKQMFFGALSSTPQDGEEGLSGAINYEYICTVSVPRACTQFVLVGVVWCGSKRKVRKSVEVVQSSVGSCAKLSEVVDGLASPRRVPSYLRPLDSP